MFYLLQHCFKTATIFFLTEIIIKSNELGVKINTDKNYINLNKIDIENENIFEFNILEIINNYK